MIDTITALKAGETFFHILKTVPLGFISVDSQWKVLYCSPTTEDFPMATGKNLLELFPGREYSNLYYELKKALALQKAVQFEHHYTPLDLWVEINAQPLRNTLSIYFRNSTTQKEQVQTNLEHQSRLDQVLDLSSEIIWEYDIATRQVFWQGNKLAKLLNHDRENLDPVEVWEKHVHPEDFQTIRASFEAALQNGESFYTSHYRLRKKDGEYIHVRDRGQIIRNSKGEPIKAIGITGDITVTKLYEQALIQAKASYQSLFELSPLPRWIYEEESLRFLDVNRAATRHYGYSREEFLKMNILELYPGEERFRLEEHLGNNQPVSGVWTHLKKSGEEILVEISEASLEFQNKRTHLCTLSDITEKKKTEQALKASEQKLSTILESIGDGLLVVDQNWTITYLNGKAENLLGHHKAYYLNRHLWEVFNDAVKLNSYREYHRAMKENIPVRFEDFYPALNAWFEINAYPTADGLSIYFNNITEKKRQQQERREHLEKLRQAEEDLRHVLESMTDGFYTVDRNWNIKFATDKVAAMLGVNKEDYLGKNLWDCFPEAVDSKIYTEFHRAFKEGRPVSFEEYNPVYNIWFDINAYPHADVLAVYVKDITERKNNEKRLEFIARATSEVIWELDLHSRKVVFNEEKFHAVFGYRLASNCNHYSFWLDKVHHEDAGVVIEKNRLALKQYLDSYMNEYRFKKSDGSWAYIKDRIYVVRNNQNQPVSLIGAMEDVTAERVAEKALMESEQTYKQLFDHASLPKAVYDRETLRILNINQAAIDHYGYSREEFLNMTVLDVRPSEDHEKILEVVSKTNVNSKRNIGVWTHLKKGGERIQAEVSVATINYKGKVCNLTTVLDVTEKLKLQEQLTCEKIEKQQGITKATLEAQEKERSEISRELHDGVNQVLTTAKLYVENIKYYPEQKEAFVDKSVSLLQKSINEIRMLSRALVTPTVTDKGFKEALLEMIHCYQELNLFEIDYKIDASAETIENEIKLTVYRIMQEQLNNIVKYANASRVIVQILQETQELLLIIKDNGIGFDPAQKKSGLGLSNIKNRAELFNGKTKIESAPSRGCCIEVRFAGKN